MMHLGSVQTYDVSIWNCSDEFFMNFISPSDDVVYCNFKFVELGLHIPLGVFLNKGFSFLSDGFVWKFAFTVVPKF